MRSWLTTLGELVGAAAITLGAGLAWLPAGFIVGGALLIGLSYLASQEEASGP